MHNVHASDHIKGEALKYPIVAKPLEASGEAASVYIILSLYL